MRPAIATSSSSSCVLVMLLWACWLCPMEAAHKNETGGWMMQLPLPQGDLMQEPKHRGCVAKGGGG